MTLTRLLVANRGEIAIRVCRAASDLGIATVAMHSEDDAASLHTRMADEAYELPGLGAAAYLDIDAVVAAAIATSCDAVHPGYGFLSENADFARTVGAAGLTFVGPTPEQLELFGDKGRARSVTADRDVPVLDGSFAAVTLEQARTIFDAQGGGGLMIKALAGGGGRGSRAVTEREDLDDAFTRCSSEALAAFGNGDLYVEAYFPRARHIEVQVVGDTSGTVIHLGERECSAQRRYQKVIEMAPAPGLSPSLRAQLHDAAVAVAASVGYQSLGTFEFLVDTDAERFVFIEANARLQVEHTVTEEVTGIDLVQTQLQIAGGATLAELGLTEPSRSLPRGTAIQARVNMETMGADGSVMPSSGVLAAYDAPSGPGVRTDGFGYSGYKTSTAFDSLLAKVIAHAATPEAAASRLARALSEFRIDGVATNIDFLIALLARPALLSNEVHTRFIDDNVAGLVAEAALVPSRFGPSESGVDAAAGLAGAQVDATDPLALFAHGQASREAAAVEVETGADLTGPEGSVGLPAPVQGTVVAIVVAEGDAVSEGSPLVVLEAMKMEHVIKSDRTGIVKGLACAEGDVILEGFPLVFVLEADVEVEGLADEEAIDPDHIRGDLAELYERKAFTLDENRPDAVERRRKRNQMTARENIDAICDPGSFKEYGPLVLAAQRARRSREWLQEKTPADGLVGGLATVNGDTFDDEKARCMAIAYDYTVLAGTQGTNNHYKQDRLFDVARRFKLPILFFTEGGGGRPGDTEFHNFLGMDTYTFTQFSKLSGEVPLVGLNSGYCFAGNTAMLACCDVIIATKQSTIAMGGPAMIEGGGLGVYAPEEVGPMSFQVPNGVVDILVEDDAELIEVGKKYISYFQGPIDDWEAPDQRAMRHVVPENRVRMYDMRDVINTLADVDSVLEIREQYGIGIITAFMRVEGKPMGVIANNPHHLSGAIDSDGADKGARFLQLCDAFGIPVVSIMDCPGIMVGPDAEREALVRHAARMFVTGANLTVPMFGLVIRKAYGLGVQAMCGGSSMVPLFTAAWPTAEFAGMNIEGAVKLGYRNVLADLETAEERKELFDKMTAKAYENARAVNGATYFGIDDVIDPADSRSWVVAGMRSLPPEVPSENARRAYIDTW